MPASPSVISTAQLVGHNLIGTLNLLEKCRRERAGLIILSSSRVYSIPALCAVPLRQTQDRFEIDPSAVLPHGLSVEGVSESFSTEAPVSLYGGTKLASERMALEYGFAFDFPVRINRCGVIAGPGQFGRIDQGIFSYWIYQWILGKPLAYIGFGGEGLQVRDLLAPADLVELCPKRWDDALGRSRLGSLGAFEWRDDNRVHLAVEIKHAAAVVEQRSVTAQVAALQAKAGQASTRLTAGEVAYQAALGRAAVQRIVAAKASHNEAARALAVREAAELAADDRGQPDPGALHEPQGRHAQRACHRQICRTHLRRRQQQRKVHR